MILGSGLLQSSWPRASDWLIRDEFTDTRAAGSVNGTAATPGPGTRAVTDTGNLVAINGQLEITAGGTYNDPILNYGAVTKAVGLAVGSTILQSDTLGLLADVGFDDNASGDLREHRFFFNTDGTISARDGSRFSLTYNTVIGAYAVNTLYSLAVIMLETQVVWIIKGGAYTGWTMLHKATRSAGAPTTLYPAINTYNRDAIATEMICAVLPNWTDSTIAALNDGDEITGGASTVLDAFFP